MTAVANPPSFPLNKPAWGGNGGQSIPPMTDDVRAMFGRKGLQRSNSSSSISSNSSNSSTTTVATTSSQLSGTPASSNGEVSQWPSTAPRKRPQSKGPWPPGKVDGHADLARMAGSRTPMMNGGPGGAPPMHQQPGGQPQNITQQQGVARPLTDQVTSGVPVLYLLSLNGTFERKTIQVPFAPDTLRIGRQTNQKTVPTPANGYFDSKVLSRQHAEIWADRAGKIWIRDVKSSNGTFVNGTRLSQENRESEPHELQTADHLELGIDIVSEDQKTVVHHKVAAKVEHAGFLSPSSNLLDMNFGDLDPANGNAMSSGQGTMHVRSRNGSNASIISNGRIISTAGLMGPPTNGVPHQRGYWVTPITAEQIVKRLQNEMRGARLQAQDLGRTGQFLSTLLSKDDIKDLEKPEVPEAPKQQHMVNGNGIPYRADPKARFSDPPAPPPQQPLPEKPDMPSLKRGITERPKSHPSNTSPIRDNLSQILQLQEDLKSTRRELEGRDARLRELEESLLKERLARESAEELARRLEESATAAAMATASSELEHVEPISHVHLNGSAKGSVEKALLEEAFEPPQDLTAIIKPDSTADDVEKSLANQAESTEAAAVEYRTRIDEMATELRDMKEQLELWRKRCETAESEREVDRKTLSEMVLRIRQDEEARQASALAAAATAAVGRERSRGRSKNRRLSASGQADQQRFQAPLSAEQASPRDAPTQADGVVRDDSSEKPTLSRANTITPQKPPPGGLAQDQAIAASLPYASMLGVVLLGMGLMAYINGWQTGPKLDR